MHEIHIQLTEHVYNQAKRRAVEAGFSSLDEYILDVVKEDAAQQAQNFDDRFTPKVVAHLNRIQEKIKAGAKTFSEEELDGYLQQKAQEWRKSQTS